ncbi:hypothetical protein OH76DRAFT_1480810 [Lentinus brumalis]|uniref:Uncharacterized protein n=1 Tax=Lentinus brumalis TaxID=2498619 RepID=A0A371DI27_9APHY|nr:hypothetical protein OH76DRAFT_1480810 [Polyporus brumalis]
MSAHALALPHCPRALFASPDTMKSALSTLAQPPRYSLARPSLLETLKAWGRWDATVCCDWSQATKHAPRCKQTSTQVDTSDSIHRADEDRLTRAQPGRTRELELLADGEPEHSARHNTCGSGSGRATSAGRVPGNLRRPSDCQGQYTPHAVLACSDARIFESPGRSPDAWKRMRPETTYLASDSVGGTSQAVRGEVIHDKEQTSDKVSAAEEEEVARADLDSQRVVVGVECGDLRGEGTMSSDREYVHERTTDGGGGGDDDDDDKQIRRGEWDDGREGGYARTDSGTQLICAPSSETLRSAARHTEPRLGAVLLRSREYRVPCNILASAPNIRETAAHVTVIGGSAMSGACIHAHTHSSVSGHRVLARPVPSSIPRVLDS